MQSPCSRCGAINATGATTCAACGSLLGSYEPTQRAAPPGMPYGSSQPNAAPSYGAPYYLPAPPPPVAPPGPPVQPVYLMPAQQPMLALAPVPQKKKSSAGLVIGILLILLAVIVIPLLVMGVFFGAGVFLLSGGAPRTVHPTPLPLYTDDLTKDQDAWLCQPNTRCQFGPDGYHILAPDDHVYVSELRGHYFSNQVIEVKGKIAQGDPQNAALAVLFRVFIEPEAYVFLVLGDGSYELVRWDDEGKATNIVPITKSSAIHPGLNQINDLKVIADDQTITLFVNGQQLKQITDDTYFSGKIALGAAGAGAVAVFSNLSVTRP